MPDRGEEVGALLAALLAASAAQAQEWVRAAAGRVRAGQHAGVA